MRLFFAFTLVVLGLIWITLVGAWAQAPAPHPRANPIQQFNDKLKKDFTDTTGAPATGDLPYDLLQALNIKLLPDLKYAKLLADATGNKITAACYGAWIDVIQTQQTAVQIKNPDGTMSDVPIPDPHLVTDFERMVELRNMIQPDAPFMLACSPVANLIKQDVLSFMGKVVGGGAGLATMIPGL